MWKSRAFLAAIAVLACSSLVRAAEGTPNRIEDVLTKPQVAYLKKRVPKVVPVTGEVYFFTFKEVPGYTEVTLYYLIRTVGKGGQIARVLAKRPSAMSYILHTSRAADLVKHLDGNDLAKVTREFLDGKARHGGDVSVRVQRTLFDIGGGPSAAFFDNREKYYNFEKGLPIFGDWPGSFRQPSGEFTLAMVHASIVRGPGDRIKIIQGTQYFGYEFPVLADLLTAKQKEGLKEFTSRANPKQGVVSPVLRDLKGFGQVKLHYIQRNRKLLEHPSAMASSVGISGEYIKKDPLVLRKYLAPEGVAHLKKRILTGERAGKKLAGVRIFRMHFDIITKAEPGAIKSHNEFKRDVGKYSRHDMLIRPDKWPEKYCKPDGLFDVEQTRVKVIWRVLKD